MTVISVHENLSQMAIGFEDGTVVIMRGDVTRDRLIVSLTLLIFMNLSIDIFINSQQGTNLHSCGTSLALCIYK